ncbi:TPA: autotransporter outer membrane beta-barrel domain-containing protein, partial [Campylobacter jejuni]|nr:autotransporter outer membrane beta-barrel domain-containing protein [Campylobacter jejuni]
KARSVASVYSPEARIDTTINTSESSTINISDSGSHSITIEKTGTLTGKDKVIYVHAKNSDTLTLTNLTNKGTINGKVAVEHDQGFKGTIAVNTFENTGQINGQIYMGIWEYSGTLNVDKFENSGTIKGSDGQGAIFFEGKGKNTNIQTFINTGTIISSGNQDATDESTLYVSSGVQMSRGYIETFNNEGLLSGKFGINLVGSTINNFKNTGTIEGTSTHQYGSAINLSGVSDDISIIKTFENEGTIKSVQANGISIGDGNKIETLINKGTIEAGLNGISFFAFGGYQKPIELGKITLEEGSSIKAGNNGIHIDGSDEGIKSDAIEVKQGAKIEGGKSGIYIGGGKEIDTQITIAGEVSGGAAGIVNEGIIGGSSSDDK